MSGVTLVTLPISDPSDTSALTTLRIQGHAVADIIAVIGKTEGNGCVNDFSRTLASTVWEPRIPSNAVTVFSGGTEGVLSPHVNVFLRQDDVGDPHFDRGLVAASGRTRIISPSEIGTAAQAHAVKATVSSLIEQLGVDIVDVHLVLVKCPLLTSDKITALRTAGLTPITTDTYESMGHSRAASSLGIAIALGECDDSQAAAALRGEAEVWSARASASAGAELDDCHVLVLAESPDASNSLRALHGEMDDAIDITSLTAVFDEVKRRGGKVRQVFAKAEADPTGTIRGLRHIMLNDSDINSTRHARAAVGAIISALKGDGAVYVSGGAEHQGPPGGGSFTVVYELTSNQNGALR